MPNSRYQQGEPIGQGGTGTVYLALDTDTGQQVAIKRFHAQLTEDSMAVSRLSEDARRASAFNNANLVRVIASDSDEQGTFLVTEQAPAGSLADRLERSGPMTPMEAIPLVQQLGRALSLCHRTRLFHGNLKPANVLMTPGGAPKLTDFGTIHLALQDDLTRELVGTEFLAPELLGENPQYALGPTADVYGLTAILYAALTGESPRGGAAWRVPPHLRLVLQKGLAEDQSERYQSIDELLNALTAIARRSGGKGARVALIAGIAVAVLTGALVFVMQGGDSNSGHQEVAAARPPDEAQPTQVPLVHTNPVAQPAAVEAQARLVSLNTVRTVTGNGYAFGFVENTGQVPIEKPRLDLEYFNDNGRSLVKGFGYASFDLIEPGERSPIKVLLKPYPEGHARYEPTLKVKPPYLQAKRLARLSVVDKSLTKRSYGTSLEAQVRVRNDDQVDLKFIEAVVVLYDDSENIVEIASSFVKEKPLAPGAEGQAQVLLLPKPDTRPSRYQVFLDATVLPE